MITAYDRGDRVGNPYGSGDVHSRFKGEIGRRMALLVANVTGASTRQWDGPHAIASQKADGSIVLVWDSPVYVNGTQDCWECCDGSRALDTFQVSPTLAGPNGTNSDHQMWTNVTWAYDEVASAVTLKPTSNPAPEKPWLVVRYAASLWPQCAWYRLENNVPARSFSDLEIGAVSAFITN